MRQRIIKTTDTSTNSSMHSCSFVAAPNNDKKTQIRLALKIYREMHEEYGTKLQMKLPQINIILKMHSLVSILEKAVFLQKVQQFEGLKCPKKRLCKEHKSVKFRDSPNIKNLMMILRVPFSRTLNQAYTRISLATHKDKSVLAIILMNLKKKTISHSFKRIKQVSRNRRGIKNLIRILNTKMTKLKMLILFKVSVKQPPVDDLMLENINEIKHSLVSCQNSFSEESLQEESIASYQQSNPLCSHQDSGMGDQQMKIAESVHYYRGLQMHPAHNKEYSLGLGSHQMSIENFEQNEYQNDISIKESLAIKFGACSMLANIFEKKLILNMFSVFISIQVYNKKTIPPTLANVPQEMLMSVTPTQLEHQRMPNYSSITSINHFWTTNQRGQVKSESDLSQISESEAEFKPQFKAVQSSNPMMPTIKTDLSGQQPTRKEMKLSIIEQLSREQSGHVTLMTYQTGQTDKTEEDVDFDEELIKQRLLAMNQMNEILRLKLKSYFNQILLSSTQMSFKSSFQKNDMGNYFAAPQKKKSVHQKKLQLLVNKVFKEDHSEGIFNVFIEAQRSTDATDLLTTINRKGSRIESKEISPEKTAVKLIAQVSKSKAEIRQYSIQLIGFGVSVLLYLTLKLL